MRQYALVMLNRGTGRHSLRAISATFALLAIAYGLGGCAAIDHLSGSDYLKSLDSGHRLDARALATCKKDGGTPISQSTPRAKILVAANSSLSAVRKIEAPGFASSSGNAILTGKRQGYAAICLIEVAGANHSRVWAFYLPDRNGGFIDPS